MKKKTETEETKSIVIIQFSEKKAVIVHPNDLRKIIAVGNVESLKNYYGNYHQFLIKKPWESMDIEFRTNINNFIRSKKVKAKDIMKLIYDVVSKNNSDVDKLRSIKNLVSLNY